MPCFSIQKKVINLEIHSEEGIDNINIAKY